LWPGNKKLVGVELDKKSKTANATSDGPSVALSALIFASGTLVSRILGLVRDKMTAHYFSVEVRDAFLAAFRLPNFFRRLLGEGALSVSFVPVFIEILSGKLESRDAAEARAKQLVSGVFSILLAVTSAISLLCIIYMDVICRNWLSGEAYITVPGKMELTIRLGRIMFAFLIMITLYAFFMAILTSMRKFAMSALAPCFFNIALISAAFISDKFAAPENVLAWAVVVGGFFQMAVLIPEVWKSGYFPKFTLKWSSPDLMRVFKVILPSVFGLSILQLTGIINGKFASGLAQGTISNLYFADRILELPLAMFAVSMGSALLPTLSKYWSEHRREEMSATLNQYLRLLAFVSLPAAVGMFILSLPIVELLFHSGKFGYQDVMSTALILQVYAFGLLLSAGVRVLAQGFYAMQNTWYPAAAGAMSLVSHVILVWSLTAKFGLVGMASATVLSTGVNLTLLALYYHKWIAPLKVRDFSLSFLKFAICSVPLALICFGYDWYFARVSAVFLGWKPWFTQTLALATIIPFAGLAYLGAAYLMKIPEVKNATAIFTTKLRRKMNR
jgi:putative peptidoglycan lipid II flippase